jgi:anti-sigma-K factor RskA
MYDEDLDALAAEYVLGTLASDERAHAEALIAIDPGFAEIVHQWERRLGELNVMVEAVEPPPEVWSKIKSGLNTVALGDDVRLVPNAPTPPAAIGKTAAETKAEAEPKAESEADNEPETEAETEGDESPLLAALATTLMSPEGEAEGESQPEVKSPAEFKLRPSSPVAPDIERGADVFYLAHRVRRWRGIAVGTGALAAALALFIVLSQAMPGLIPTGGFRIPQLFAQSAAPPAVAPAAPGSQLVAVLQQDPASPAFLLTIDPASRMLTVRRVSAAAAAGHNYELWLIPPNSSTPRALGVVGVSEFTQPKLPSEFDVDTMRGATYAVSYEPAGGSKTGAPTGPILFTGRPFEAVPASTPPSKT